MTWSTGRKILNIRRDLGIKQQELPKMAGVTPSSMSKIERMEFDRNPRAEVLHGIARALWVTADYFFVVTIPRMALAPMKRGGEPATVSQPDDNSVVRVVRQRLSEPLFTARFAFQ